MRLALALRGFELRAAYPLRASPAFPRLTGGGSWRTEPPFIGAVLLATTIAAAGEPLATSRRFLDTAIAAGRTLVAD